MGNIFKPEDRHQLIRRINELNEEAQPLWGVMTVNEMLCHITDPFRDVMGLRRPKSLPRIMKPLVKLVVTSKLPYKKNLPALNVYRQGRKGNGTKPVNFQYDKANFINLLHQLGTTSENYPLYPHPGAGSLKRKEYGYFLWKHTDHHLQQFGV